MTHGAILIILGLLFRMQLTLFLIPAHMLLGIVFALLLRTRAALAVEAGVDWRLIMLAIDDSLLA